jgi:hypothetical protein
MIGAGTLSRVPGFVRRSRPGSEYQPNESVKTTLSFLAPVNARTLYLTGGQLQMPWVYLYFGSDISPFHRRTLLRIL